MVERPTLPLSVTWPPSSVLHCRTRHVGTDLACAVCVDEKLSESMQLFLLWVSGSMASPSSTYSTVSHLAAARGLLHCLTDWCPTWVFADNTKTMSFWRKDTRGPHG